jgi:SpoVK/Ycf46/Vps4 family AAA+-type ATPase
MADRRRFNSARLQWEAVGGESSNTASLLRAAQELRGGGIVAVEDVLSSLRPESANSPARMTLAHMLSAETDNSEGLVLVFVEPPEAEAALPSMLADQFVRMSVPYPRASELEAMTREELALLVHRSGVELPVERIQQEARRLSPGLGGLTRSAARDALRDALAPNLRDFPAAAEQLQRRKAEHLQRELSMNILDAAEVEVPIGLDYLVQHLATAKQHMRVTGPGRAKGVIMLGPPGTGKGMVAKAIGKIVGLPVVEFRIAALMSSLLGETERRFAQAFATLEAMAPNVVFIDEIEKAFGDSTERDGGTMMRCTGALLSWLSDNPHPNFIVAAGNSLRAMGGVGLTMTRSGRFDASFFVDVPNCEARRRMLTRWLEGSIADHETVSQELAELSDKFSGADLFSVVKDAKATSDDANTSLTRDVLRGQMERKRARAIALYDEFQELRRWGRLYCEPAGPTEQERGG